MLGGASSSAGDECGVVALAPPVQTHLGSVRPSQSACSENVPCDTFRSCSWDAELAATQDKDKSKFVFSFSVDGRTWILAAVSEQEREKWIHFLEVSRMTKPSISRFIDGRFIAWICCDRRARPRPRRRHRSLRSPLSRRRSTMQRKKMMPRR